MTRISCKCLPRFLTKLISGHIVIAKKYVHTKQNIDEQHSSESQESQQYVDDQNIDLFLICGCVVDES